MHGVNQRERLIPMSVYRKELAKARLGDNIANHMGFIFTAVLYTVCWDFRRNFLHRYLQWQEFQDGVRTELKN